MAIPTIAILSACALVMAAATPTPTEPATLPADVLYEALGRWYLIDGSSENSTCISIDISVDGDAMDRVCFTIESGLSVCSNISTAHDGWISPMGDLMSILYKTERVLVLGYGGLPGEEQTTCYATVLAREPFPTQADLNVLRRELQSVPHLIAFPASRNYSACPRLAHSPT